MGSTLAEQERLADQIALYWRKKGYDNVQVWPEKREYKSGERTVVTFEIVSNLVNGRPVSA